MTHTDPREMRKALQELGRGRSFVDASGKLDAMAPLVRNIMHAAWAEGWNGEDMMTALAYHALLQASEYQKLLLDQAMLSTAPHLMPKEKP